MGIVTYVQLAVLQKIFTNILMKYPLFHVLNMPYMSTKPRILKVCVAPGGKQGRCFPVGFYSESVKVLKA